jgi:2-iminobutanoate/2-iminopropanoate deaminase
MKYISTPEAPQPAGHYSQAVEYQGLIFVAGQVPRPGREPPASIEDQASLTLSNLAAILEAAGSGMDRVLKVTVYLTEIETWDRVNVVYARFFGAHRPARTVVPIGALRNNYRIEVDAIAAAADGSLHA